MQVFISSTFEDLRSERESISWTILKLGHIPVGMENFSSMTDRGWEVIKNTIDNSDIYVLIVAGKYGSIEKESGLGWTEKEYEYAVGKKMPILVFIRDNKSTPVSNYETTQKNKKS
jgi:hypothetical protein